MEKKIKDVFQTHWFPVLFAFVLALGFILVFSSSTSPLSYYYNGDSSSPAITVARGWYYDFIPYKDLFSSEGPWMYFLGKVGITLAHGNKTGIAIIQIMNLFLFLLSIYMMTTLTTNNKFYSCVVLVIVCCILKCNYPDGFYPEEFLLPIYGFSLYCFLTRNKHTVIKSFFFGLFIGITIMCAYQYTLIFITITILYLLSLLLNKEWKKFLLSIACIVLGILLIITPFYLYFKNNNCLDEFIYDVFQYNKDIYYTNERYSYVYKKLVLLRYPALFLLVISVIGLFKKKYLESISFLILCFIEIYVFYSLKIESQYSMFIVGNTVLLTNALFELLPLKELETNIFCLICATIPIYFLFTFIYPIYTSRIYSYQNIYHNEGWEGLLDNIDSVDFDSIVFYGTPSLNNAYLNSNEMPVYKYFYEQDDLIENNETLKEDILDTYNTLKAKWIITNKPSSQIKDILDEHYALVEKTGMYYIYLLRTQ